MPFLFNIDSISPTSNDGVATDYATLDNLPKVNNITITGDKDGHDYGLLDTSDIGKGVQLGFDGVVENNIIKFYPPETSGTYTISQDYEYEIDLHLPVVGALTETDEVRIYNDSEEILISSPKHRTTSTSSTYSDLKQLFTYDTTNGYRSVFKARCKVTSDNKKIFFVYSSAVDFANAYEDIILPITNSEMLDIVSETTHLYRGRVLNSGEIFVCVDDDGYLQGHVYKWTGSDWVDCFDINIYLKSISGYNASKLQILNNNKGSFVWTDELSGGTATSE